MKTSKQIRINGKTVRIVSRKSIRRGQSTVYKTAASLSNREWYQVLARAGAF